MTDGTDHGDAIIALIDNLDQFREATVEALRVLHRKQAQTAKQVQANTDAIALQGLLLWLLLGSVIVGLLAFLASILTR